MTFSARARYLLVTGAIVLASAIQLVRGYRPLIVIVGAVAFLLMGNLMVYLSGSKEREMRRQRKRDYYAGKI
jgi:hypothetical protein